MGILSQLIFIIMKRKVYWIRVEQLYEVYKCITQNDASIICQEHYQLIDDLPHLCCLSNKKTIVYWIENKECKMADHLNEIKDFEYKQLTISSFLINNKDENRLQKEKTHVVRGDDGEGNRVQGRVRKITVTVGYLSHKTIKG
jgi:hypothetical protein